MNKITKKILSAAIATAVALSFTGFLSMDSNADGDCGYKLSGMAHVQDQGDTAGSFDSSTGILTLGTRGLGRRVEAVTIQIDEAPEGLKGGIEYQVHVQDIGWMDWVEGGESAGTSGQSKRLEGIRIDLYGQISAYYTVQYQVHIQDYGDAQGFVNEGALAGTTGESKRLEEVQIKLVKLDEVNGSMSVNYRVHRQDFGWESTYAKDGASSGTTGQSKRLEGIEIFLSGNQYEGGIDYRTHVQDYGWEYSWLSDGEMSGTQGEAKRLEAIQIELYGEVASYYDVYYRVHSENYGWLGWAKNGDPAGTAGKGLRLEAIEIKLVAKGGEAPGSTEGSFKYNDIAFDSLGVTQVPNDELFWYWSEYLDDHPHVYLGTRVLDLYGDYALIGQTTQTCKYFYSSDATFSAEELASPIATATAEESYIDWCLVYINGKPTACWFGSDDYYDRDKKSIPGGYYKCIVYDEAGNEIVQGTCYVM